MDALKRAVRERPTAQPSTSNTRFLPPWLERKPQPALLPTQQAAPTDYLGEVLDAGEGRLVIAARVSASSQQGIVLGTRAGAS